MAKTAGLIGELSSYLNFPNSISNSYFIGSITATNFAPIANQSNYIIGGLVASSYDIVNINKSFARVQIKSVISDYSLGCFIGIYNGGTISDSYTHCTLETGNNSDYVGGFIGNNTGGVFERNYSVSQISHGTGFTNYGVFAGQDFNTYTTYANNFYSSTTNFITNPTKVVTTSTTGIIQGETTPNLFKQNTFTSKGWDFTNVWEIQEGLDYPTLRSLPIADTYCTTNSRSTNSPFANSSEAGIDGLTENTAFTICTPSQFLEIASDTAYWDKYFILKSHLDFNGLTPSEPIENWGDAFTGILDGNNKTIRNYTYHDSNNMVGVFGEVHSPAVIKNLKLLDIDIQGRQFVGGLMGESQGDAEAVVENLIISGKVKATNFYAGSVASQGLIIMRNVHSYAEITAPNSVGGLIGDLNSNSSLIKNSSFQGIINSTGSYVGGLVSSLNSGSIEDSFSTASITGTGTNVGGLVGYGFGSGIYRSFSTGNIVGSDYVGGLVGYSGIPNLNDVYATGNIRGNSSVGGLVGYSNSSTINRAYAIGTVETTTSDGGGVIGYLNGTSALTYSFFAGASVTANTATNSVVGRIIGNAFSGTQSNNYYSSNSICSNSGGGSCNAFGISVDTTTSPTYFFTKTNNPFVNGSWDFINTWVQNSNSYPTLKP